MLGIDVSKDWLSVCSWDAGRRGPRWLREVPNNEEGVRLLLAQTSPREPWALEPTGRYSELAARLGIAPSFRAFRPAP